MAPLATVTVETAIPPVPGESSEVAFDLPGDFYRFIDQTQWNAAMRLHAKSRLWAASYIDRLP